MSKDKFRAARLMLIRKYVFFGSIAMMLELIEDKAFPAPAGTDGKRLVFNPILTEKWTLPETTGVIAHEVLHVTLLHHLRRKERDPGKWNRACITLDNFILMCDGSYKPLYEIKPGDVVLSPFGPNKVLGITYNGEKPVGVLNHSLRCTPDHRILTNEGFKDAKNCTDRKIYISRNASPPSGSVRQPQNAQPIAVGRVNQCEVQDDCGVSQTSGAAGRSVRNEKGKHGTVDGVEWGRPSVLCGADRERGDDNSHHFNHTEWASLCEGESPSNDYIIFYPEAFGETGILWDRKYQQHGESVLEDSAERDFSGRFFGEAGTSFDREASSLSSSNSAMQRAISAAKERKTDTEYESACSRDKSFELTKGHFQQREGDIQPVFDLITEKGAYIAGGVVVHNCDYVINLELISQFGMNSDFKLPEGALLDPKFQDMNAEMVYDLLPDDPSGGGQGFDQVMDGEPGASESSLKEAEARVKAMVQNAAALARKAGQMNGSLEKLVEAICEPKADWRSIVRDYLTAKAEIDYNWTKPHQRMVHQYGIVYPTLDGEKLGSLVMIIDASGSCFNNQEQFCAEVSDILAAYECELDVIFHDTKVTHIDHYTSDDLPIVMRPRGFGGTDPVEAYKMAVELNPDLIIHLTDMEMDWDKVDIPQADVLIACTEKRMMSKGPKWARVVDIS